MAAEPPCRFYRLTGFTAFGSTLPGARTAKNVRFEGRGSVCAHKDDRSSPHPLPGNPHTEHMMSRTKTPSTERRTSFWHETSLNTKAFSVMLASIFALTLSAAAVGWAEAHSSAEASGAVSPVAVPLPRTLS